MTFDFCKKLIYYIMARRKYSILKKITYNIVYINAIFWFILKF
jgi:hypothetical protein